MRGAGVGKPSRDHQPCKPLRPTEDFESNAVRQHIEIAADERCRSSPGQKLPIREASFSPPGPGVPGCVTLASLVAQAMHLTMVIEVASIIIDADGMGIAGARMCGPQPSPKKRHARNPNAVR